MEIRLFMQGKLVGKMIQHSPLEIGEEVSDGDYIFRIVSFRNSGQGWISYNVQEYQ